ncbi:MAG: hypothetical protein OXE43_11860 [Chloroflexi bacterium]|nr:hypothetical protein [Chloroflexota bacterium]
MTVEDRDQADTGSQDPASTGVYVDIENLQGEGQAMVERLIEDWPATFPQPSRIALHVPADEVELWKIWATSKFGDLEVVVQGTQHFSGSSSKNSADLAIATSAIADLVVGRVTHVAILSDDSDFMSVFVAIRDEPAIPLDGGRVPFLWVVTDRVASLSPRVKQFFPPEQLHVAAFKGSVRAQGAGKRNRASPRKTTQETWAEMAAAIVDEVGVGSFKSTECQELISERWPKHHLATAHGSAFGTEFKNNIWPVLEGWGVEIANPGKKPVRYEMTEKAKRSAHRQ